MFKRSFKKIKKAICFITAMAIAIMMAAPAFAATVDEPSSDDSKTVYVYNVEAGVTVKAYQLISATYDSKGNGLTGYEVANGLTIEDLESPTADEITTIAAGIFDGDITPSATTKLTYGTDGSGTACYYGDLAAGMWLILVWDSGAVAYSPMIVSNWYTDANLASSLTAGSVSADGDFIEGTWSDGTDVASRTYSGEAVYAKSDPDIDVDKEIANYSSDDSHESDSGSGADYNIGDTVSFKITTRIPSYSAAYFKTQTSAVFSIIDTLSAGLDPITASDLTVTVGGTDYSASDSTYAFTATTNNDGSQTFTIEFVSDFIKVHGNQTVIVEYSTTLNKIAEVVGDTSASYNLNEVDLEYSNSPTTTFSTENSGGGDKNYIYTFSITDELTKVYTGGTASAAGNTVTVTNALAGAEFTIYTDEECSTVYTNGVNSTATSDSNGYISFSGLEEGTYFITETDAPSNYMINDTVYKVVIAATYDIADGSTTEGMLTEYTVTVTDLDSSTSYSNTYTVTYTTESKSYTSTGSSGSSLKYTWYEVTGTTVSASQNPVAIVDPDLIKLPSTGGKGILILVIVSAGIIITACAVTNKKKKRA